MRSPQPAGPPRSDRSWTGDRPVRGRVWLSGCRRAIPSENITRSREIKFGFGCFFFGRPPFFWEAAALCSGGCQ